MFKEFKEFIAQGNVVDLAVGMIIGAAFGSIVNSFVVDIISPLIGLITGNTDMSALVWTLRPETLVNGEVVEAIVLNLGNFLTAVIDFLIIGFSIFMVIKAFNSLKKKEEVVEEEVVEVNETERLLSEILLELKDKE